MIRKGMSCPICRKPLVIRKRRISVVRSLPHFKRYSWCKNCGIGWLFQQVRFCKWDEPVPSDVERAMIKQKRVLQRDLHRLEARLAK